LVVQRDTEAAGLAGEGPNQRAEVDLGENFIVLTHSKDAVQVIGARYADVTIGRHRDAQPHASWKSKVVAISEQVTDEPRADEIE